jgi:predicted metal-dependent hydrolase
MAKYLSEQDALKQRVARWAIKLKVKPRLVRIQRMTRKWGSCSSAGTITLAIDLLDEPEGFQDFVVAHELLHLRIPNHGRLFKALMTAYVPGWRSLETRCSVATGRVSEWPEKRTQWGHKQKPHWRGPSGIFCKLLRSF